MEKKRKCENQIEKPYNYMSASNPSGLAFRKCGNVAVKKSMFGVPLCRKCVSNYPGEVVGLPSALKENTDE